MIIPDFKAQVMPPEQASLLKELGSWTRDRGYYLAGGTAVALWLGHRSSIDFDWFSDQPATEPQHVPDELRQIGAEFTVRSQTLQLIDGHIREIRATFVQYAYPVLVAPSVWPEFGCAIASLVDLCCMKLAAVAQRGSRKDFIDIDAIFRHGVSLTEVLGDYRRKYNVSDVMPILRGLAYFEDAERERMPEMLVPLDWTRLKSRLLRLTTEAFEKLPEP